VAYGEVRRDQNIRCVGHTTGNGHPGADEPFQGPRDDDRLGYEWADVLVRRLFAVGFDLHTALTRIEEPTASAAEINSAIGGVDEAIKDIHRMIFNLRLRGPERRRPGVRGLIIEAVERACGSAGGECPAISVGSGVEAVTDEVTALRVAQMVHRFLTAVPCDQLPGAHVDVIADPRPPARLIVQIDAPGPDLADIADQIRIDAENRIEVRQHPLTTAPLRSRIRLECRTDPP
jgi:hypothetical protein